MGCGCIQSIRFAVGELCYIIALTCLLPHLYKVNGKNQSITSYLHFLQFITFRYGLSYQASIFPANSPISSIFKNRIFNTLFFFLIFISFSAFFFLFSIISFPVRSWVASYHVAITSLVWNFNLRAMLCRKCAVVPSGV